MIRAMQSMGRYVVAVGLAVLVTGSTAGAADAPATAELTALVREFLAGVSRNDASVHDRFWADDLVYTRAAGERIGKADILRDVKSAKPAEATTAYAAEDIRVQQYGTTAIVAFRLTAKMPAHGHEPASNDEFLNTGTFVKRGGRWQAVAWQATRAKAAAATPASDAPNMGEVFFVLLKKGPAWTAERTDATAAIQAGHMANIKRLWDEKKMIVAGPSGDETGDLRGIFVFQTATRAEAEALTATDPAVKAGRLLPEIHSWWVEKRALPEAGSYCRGTP